MNKSWDYFHNVQTKDVKYTSFVRDGDVPAIWLNKKTMEEYRPRMKSFYYDPSNKQLYGISLSTRHADELNAVSPRNSSPTPYPEQTVWNIHHRPAGLPPQGFRPFSLKKSIAKRSSICPEQFQESIRSKEAKSPVRIAPIYASRTR